MGSCLCKGRCQDDTAQFDSPGSVADTGSLEDMSLCDLDQVQVDSLVLETLLVIRTLVENDQDPPPCLMKLHNVADNQEVILHVCLSVSVNIIVGLVVVGSIPS